jgi:hypothetical protein
MIMNDDVTHHHHSIFLVVLIAQVGRKLCHQNELLRWVQYTPS